MGNIGRILKCAETGNLFEVTTNGFTFNYATTTNGEYLSEAGVDIREKRELLDRSKPFTAYISSDGKHLTGWKGNILGTVTQTSRVNLAVWSPLHGKYITHYTIKDCHGGLWYGRGSEGMVINIRAYK